MNTELITKIRDIIRVEDGAPKGGNYIPEVEGAPGLYMGTWEESSDCGTTRCIAGWAINLETGHPVFNGRDDETVLHPETIALARRLGVDVANSETAASVIIGKVGKSLLGLEDDSIFYASDSTAVEWLEEHSNQEV